MATPEITLHESDLIGISMAARLTADLADQEIPDDLQDGMANAVRAAGAATSAICEEGGFDTMTGKNCIFILSVDDQAVSMHWDMDSLFELMDNQPPPPETDRSELLAALFEYFDKGIAARAMYAAFLWLGRPFLEKRRQDVRAAVGEESFPVVIILATQKTRPDVTNAEGIAYVACNVMAAVHQVPTHMLSAPKTPLKIEEPAPRSPYAPPGTLIN